MKSPLRSWLPIVATSLGLLAVAACVPRDEAGASPEPTVDASASAGETSSTSTPTPSSSTPDVVSEAAMLSPADLGGGTVLTSTQHGGPTGPDGNPEGFLGDSQWIFSMPYCDAYAGLGIDSYFSRRAIRVNVYSGSGGREVVQIVERYPDASAAHAAFEEAREAVSTCGVYPDNDFDHRYPMQAGDDSWLFHSNGTNPRQWLIVRQGELLSIATSPVAQPAGDISPVVVQHLCNDTPTC